MSSTYVEALRKVWYDMGPISKNDTSLDRYITRQYERYKKVVADLNQYSSNDGSSVDIELKNRCKS